MVGTMDLALPAFGSDQVKFRHKPRLLSNNDAN